MLDIRSFLYPFALERAFLDSTTYDLLAGTWRLITQQRLYSKNIPLDGKCPVRDH